MQVPAGAQEEAGRQSWEKELLITLWGFCGMRSVAVLFCVVLQVGKSGPEQGGAGELGVRITWFYSTEKEALPFLKFFTPLEYVEPLLSSNTIGRWEPLFSSVGMVWCIKYILRSVHN